MVSDLHSETLKTTTLNLQSVEGFDNFLLLAGKSADVSICSFATAVGVEASATWGDLRSTHKL